MIASAFLDAGPADALRLAFLVLAGLYFGIAAAVMRRYFAAPPRSRLRRAHVVGVSLGTSILVLGVVGSVVERLGEPLAWYGTPVGLLGVLTITAALVLLFLDANAFERRDGRRSTDLRPPH